MGQALRTLEGHTDQVNGVALSGDGRRAVSASWDRTVKVWDVETRQALRTLEGHTDSVHGVALSGDGRRAVSASDDGTLKVWDVETSHALRTLEGHTDSVYGVALSEDGRRAVSASWDRTVKVWDVETGQALRTLEGHTDLVFGVALSRDGRRAVSASQDMTLKVWDVETGQALRTLEGHADWVRGVALSGDGRRAVSASEDRTLRVWDLQAGTVAATFTCDAACRCCAAAENLFLLGDDTGRVHFLRLEDPQSKDYLPPELPPLPLAPKAPHSRETAFHNLPAQTSEAPLQPASVSRRSELARYLRVSWAMLTAVSTILGLVGGILTLYPYLSIDQDFLFDPKDPYTASFHVVNEGYPPLTHIQSSCRSSFETPDSRNIIFDHNETNGLQPTDKPPGPDYNVTDTLAHLDRVSITCASPVKFLNLGAPVNVVSAGRLDVILFYRIFGYPRREVFKFKLAKDRDGIYHWQSMGG